MKKIMILILIMISFIGCTKKNKGEEIEYRRGIIYTLDGKQPYTGEGSSYYDKKHIESKGYAKNGKPEGMWIHYFYSGKVKKTGSYIKGKLEGKWIYYYYSGEVEGEVNYKDGKEI